MKHFFLFLFGLSCMAVKAEEFEFTQKANLPADARHRAHGMSIGNKGYLGCGHINAGGTTIVYNDFWEFDPASNTWTQRADFGGGGRYAGVAFSIGNKGYMGTGLGAGSGTASPGQDFWEYDPATNIWTELSPVPGTSREGAIGFSIQGKGYVGWGSWGSGDLYEYDPATDTWTAKATELTNGGPQYAAVFVLEDRYAIVSTGYFASTSNYFKYDAVTDTWSDEGLFPGTQRFGAAAFAINNKGYLGLGADWGYNDLKDFWEYNPDSTTKWRHVTDFPGSRRHYVIGISIGNLGYLGSGTNGTNLRDWWEFGLKRVEAPDTTIIDTIIDTSTYISAFDPIELNLYPNPAADYLNLDWKQIIHPDAEFRIYDRNGRLVMHDALRHAESRIQISHLPVGEYICLVIQKGELFWKGQFVKQ